MIVKFLGIIDIFIAVFFWVFGIFQIEFLSEFILVLGFILLIKGVVFIANLNPINFIDMTCAFIILASTAFILPKIVVIIVSLFLLQKGIVSLIA